MATFNNTDGKYGELIMQELKLPENMASPELLERYSKFGRRIHWVDSNNIPGAFQMNTSWWFKPNRETVLANPNQQVGKAHHHGYPEILGFFGSDPYNPYDLGGEIELHIDGEIHLLTKSSLVFIPPELPHCPLLINKVDRPIFHFSVVMNSVYDWSRDENDEKK